MAAETETYAFANTRSALCLPYVLCGYRITLVCNEYEGRRGGVSHRALAVPVQR
jgi:hypothetical protein